MTTFGKSTIFLGLLVVLALGLFLFLKPSAPAPVTLVSNVVTPSSPLVSKCGFTLISPKPNDIEFITEPGLHIEAIVSHPANATCNWTVFEAVAGSAVLKSEDGTVLGSTNLMAEGDWMTNDPVNFSGTIAFSASTVPTENAILTITEDDPSGMGNTDSISVPLVIAQPPSI